MIIHAVNQGETLFSISSKYNVSENIITEINQLPNPDNLVVGQNILILFPEIIHKVKEGETLFSISNQYNTNIIEILRNNPSLNSMPLIANTDIVIKFGSEKYDSVITNGYTYGNIPEEELRQMLPYFTFVSPFTYGLTKEGNLVRPEADEVLRVSSYYPTKPLMHISTITPSGLFSIEPITKIFNTPSLWNTVLNNILTELKQFNYAGVDIDLEFINPSDSLKYAQFVSFLKANLNPYGYIVITALAPKTSSQQKGILYEGHNYNLLAEASNLAFIMTYEWGYTYGPPMAVAPIESVKRVIEYALTQMPSEKILMGIPSYGYNWTLPYRKGNPPAVSVSTNTAIMTALKYKADILYDDYSQSPYFYYTDENNTVHEVWFEDSKSSLSKLKLINNYSLSGCGYWNLERPFIPNYMILNNLYNITEYN